LKKINQSNAQIWHFSNIQDLFFEDGSSLYLNGSPYKVLRSVQNVFKHVQEIFIFSKNISKKTNYTTVQKMIKKLLFLPQINLFRGKNPIGQLQFEDHFFPSQIPKNSFYFQNQLKISDQKLKGNFIEKNLVEANKFVS
jgi:hypothetical protein